MRYIIFLILFSFLISCQNDAENENFTNQYPLIPQPLLVEPNPGSFKINNDTKIIVGFDTPEIQEIANDFAEKLSAASGFEIKVETGKEARNGSIFIARDNSVYNSESYNLLVDDKSVTINGRHQTGIFYAFQTLRQLLPISFESVNSTEKTIWRIPALKINDVPRFSYRGMHLDVSRHFFTVEDIKRFLDVMALHKMNKFHWHLTDDQGWRIEIKQYPKLTEIGAWRDETLIGHGGKPPFEYDGKKTGGFYSQEEIKEIIAYATKKQITIIPEIEMPGHARAALAAYPELACTDGPFTVAKRWGVFEDVFCPTDETFTFLENVLTEVIELFPGEYIHIGGDECPKTRWEESAFCQNLIKKEGLKDEHELQSYFIKRIERFVNSKGRKIIGWDEILEGGLAPDATVMSWRGMEGGIEAARLNHKVIMTPTDFCYFDYYQGNPEIDPLAIGGNLSLQKVYSFEPVPKGLFQSEQTNIIGAQANLWTEYIKTADYAEYMLYPRTSALAEVVWSPKEARNWFDFTDRLSLHIDRLKAIGVNVAPHLYDVKSTIQVDPENDQVALELSKDYQSGEIRYSLNGDTEATNWETYSEPIVLNQNTEFSAVLFENGEKKGRDYKKTFTVHKAIAKDVFLTHLYHNKFPGSGPYALVDGTQAEDYVSHKSWQGYEGTDFIAEIDLGPEATFSSVEMKFLNRPDSWIFMPKEVEITYTDDGVSYTSLGKFSHPEAGKEDNQPTTKSVKISGEEVKARFLKIVAKSIGPCPKWHSGAGGKSWLFVDEIIVE